MADIFDRVSTDDSKGGKGDVFDRVTPSTSKSRLGRPTAADFGEAFRPLTKALPYAGGIAGGVMGGIPGAVVGGAAGKLAETALSPDKPPVLPQALHEAAVSGVTQGAYEAGGQVLGKVVGATLGKYFNPQRLYQSALKPAGASEVKAAKAVGAGLKEGIPLGTQSTAVARQRINTLNGQIEGIIQQQPADIPAAQWVSNVRGKLDALRATWGKVAGRGNEYLQQIDDFEQTLLNQHPGAMAASTAQQVKKATYEAIRTAKGTAWDPGVHPGLQVRMMKDTARALKEELQTIYPSLQRLNADEGALIGLEKELDRFAKRDASKQMTPFFAPVAAGGLALAGHGEAGLGVLGAQIVRSALEDPGVKSRIAIALYKAAQKPGLKIAAEKTGEAATRVLPRAAGYAAEQ